jgi:hypothetical protein
LGCWYSVGIFTWYISIFSARYFPSFVMKGTSSVGVM